MPSYLGQTTRAQGAQTLPFDASGAIDINALVGQLTDRRKTYIYDTIKFPPNFQFGTQPYQIFSNRNGAADPYNGGVTKTILETNMTKSGEFSSPYDMIIFNLAFKYQPDALLADILTFERFCWVEFKILEKQMWAGHTWRHPAGAGINGMSTQAPESAYNNGLPAPGYVWDFGLRYGKYIPSNTGFSLTLNFNETYQQYYNLAGSTGNGLGTLPANITAGLGGVTGAPQLLPTSKGGNGLVVQIFMNGLSDAPVQ